MKACFAAICAAGVAALFTGCAPAPPPDTHDADVQAIKDNETQWNKDFESKDVEKLVAHYTDDATLMSPGDPPTVGKDAIRAVLKTMLGDSGLTLKFQTVRVEVAKSGDLAFTQGAYTMTMTDPATKKPISDKGSYMTGYKKQADGSWKAVSDIASSETPPGPPPAPKKK